MPLRAQQQVHEKPKRKCFMLLPGTGSTVMYVHIHMYVYIHAMYVKKHVHTYICKIRETILCLLSLKVCHTLSLAALIYRISFYCRYRVLCAAYFYSLIAQSVLLFYKFCMNIKLIRTCIEEINSTLTPFVFIITKTN